MNFANPYSFYEEKRLTTPIFRGDCGTWYLTRYNDVKMLLSDSRFMRRPANADHGILHQQTTQSAIDKIIDKWPIYSDPPDHPRIRLLLDEVFNPIQIKAHRATVNFLAKNLLEMLLKYEKVDFMANFAFPLPLQMINTLLGTSLDEKTTREWSYCLGSALDGGSPEDIEPWTQTLETIHHYFKELISNYQKNPKDNWISRLLALLTRHSVTVDDLISICIFLFISAYETTQLALGCGLLSLLKNPAQLALLQNNPLLIPSAVEEILRYESPVSKLSRWTRERVTIGNVNIPSNELVVGLINAANHDPDRFPNPDVFDITRSNNRHLALSYGSHSCQGGVLARVELQTAFSLLLPHLSRFRLIAEETEWLPNSSLRYLYKLMIGISH